MSGKGAHKCCGDARRRGVTANEIAALIVHWRAIQDRFDEPIGALYHRILWARPNEPTDRKWPNPSAAFQARERAARRDRHYREQSAVTTALQTSTAADQATDQERRTRYGPILDAMSPADRADLERRANVGSSIRRGAALYRDILIDQLAAEDQATGTEEFTTAQFQSEQPR
jgi:hypothetical protein